MKINKIFIGLGAALILLFLIFSNVFAASSDQKVKQKETKWELGKHNLKKGQEPKPIKNMKLDIQNPQEDQPLPKDNSDSGKHQARKAKADSLN